jgi:hypothetical protein
MECFEQSVTTKELEKKVKKSISAIADSDMISNFILYSGDRTISFQVKNGIDKFQLSAIKRATGYELSSIDLIKNKMVVVLEQ